MPLSCAQMELMDVILMDAEHRKQKSIESNIPMCTEEQKLRLLQAIHFIMHDQLMLVESSIDVLDNVHHGHPIRKVISASSGREFWKVSSTFTSNRSHSTFAKNHYVCTTTYCSCKRFAEQAKVFCNDGLLCKHLLAVRIGTALNLILEEVVDDAIFVEMMCQHTT